VAVLVPVAPSNLVAQQTSPTQINLSWRNNDLSMSATSIRVERSPGNTSNFVPIATLEASATSYMDTTFQAPNTFSYRVFAVNAKGDSLPSNVATLAALLVPAAPGNLTGFQNTTTEVDLHWTNTPPPIATHIRIERSVGDPNHFMPLATLGVVTSYADTTAMAPNIYYYRVIATDAYGDSDPSNTIRVSVQLVAGPLAYWQFDETSGTTAADASGHGNTGTLVGLTDGTMEHVPGQFGGALHFEDHLPDGTVLQTGDARLPVVTVPDAPDLNPTNAITLEAWIKADTWGGTTSNNHRVLQKGLDDHQYRLTDENGVLKFDLFINGNLIDVQTALPSTGVWHHVVGTYDGTVMKLYIDAVVVAQQAVTGTIAVETDPLRIGSKDVGGTAGNHFVGTIDDVRIYGRALTQDEITFQQSWVDQDIGNVNLAGSAAVSGGVYTTRGAGADIGGTTDAFHYMYQPHNSDGSITAHVVSIDGHNPFAGLMIRQSLDPSSANVALGLTPSGLSVQYRADAGGDTTTGGSDSAATAGYWIRLVRQGNVFTAFDSADGVTWSQVGDPIVVDMASNVFIGLALTGNNDTQLATAVFDLVRLANKPTVSVPAAQIAYQNVDQPISGISIGDDPSATLTVTLSVNHGTLTLGTSTGLTTVNGNGTGTVTLTGTTANLNAALASLVYRGGHNYSGGDTLSLTAADSGVSATPASVALTVESIAQETANLQAQVSALQTAGALNQGQANSLIDKLNLKGNNGDVGKVQAFLDEVADFLNGGILTQAQANALSYWGNILLLSVTRR
jgi:hypothetical protein